MQHIIILITFTFKHVTRHKLLLFVRFDHAPQHVSHTAVRSADGSFDTNEQQSRNYSAAISPCVSHISLMETHQIAALGYLESLRLTEATLAPNSHRHVITCAQGLR